CGGSRRRRFGMGGIRQGQTEDPGQCRRHQEMWSEDRRMKFGHDVLLNRGVAKCVSSGGAQEHAETRSDAIKNAATPTSGRRRAIERKCDLRMNARLNFDMP